MKGDRVEVVVDTGQGTQTFVIEATRNGRRLEVTTSRGVVEVSEVTRGGSPVRTGRFMASRLIALVEHPAHEGRDSLMDVETRSIEVTAPPAVRSNRKPPPPMPHENGSVTPRTAAAVTAASTAFPPSLSVSIAAWVASVSTVAAAPPVPVAVAGPDGAVAAVAVPASAAKIAREPAQMSEQRVTRMIASSGR